MKWFNFLFTLLITTPIFAAPNKISLDINYKSSGDDMAHQKGIVAEGERLEAHYKRGDIDTYISMSPRHEIRKGKKVILIDFEIQNLRDGDLISESSAHVQTFSGKEAKLSLNDDELEDTLTVKVTPKTL